MTWNSAQVLYRAMKKKERKSIVYNNIKVVENKKVNKAKQWGHEYWHSELTLTKSKSEV